MQSSKYQVVRDWSYGLRKGTLGGGGAEPPPGVAQVLQSPEDLIYLQQLIVRLRPRVVVETGTYRGGLALFVASIFDQLGLAGSQVVTLDTFDVESNFHNLDNQPLCPVCLDCVRAHETELWRAHVVFFRGNSLRLSEEVRRAVAESRRGGAGPVVVLLDAQHSYSATLVELHLYGGLVDVGSYVVVQDARLDATYGRPGPLAAGAQLLQTGQWVWDRDVEVFGHTQHMSDADNGVRLCPWSSPSAGGSWRRPRPSSSCSARAAATRRARPSRRGARAPRRPARRGACATQAPAARRSGPPAPGAASGARRSQTPSGHGKIGSERRTYTHMNPHCFRDFAVRECSYRAAGLAGQGAACTYTVGRVRPLWAPWQDATGGLGSCSASGGPRRGPAPPRSDSE
ncbi:unnamed protein product [Prorocentrum cordatum]|uniref:Rhamnosyl O-methyltransferase n=1 Tax=Prorocentrum cordatum TaxID=2364126 RepID=A0ABN9UNW2_9DINO|nr:unnamed protein product [Polarella glacialis]